MTKDKWVWMPHAGHFICGNDCRFRLNTYVGKYIVSTVGELLFDSRIREIKASRAGKEIEGKGDEWDYNFLKEFGYEDLGFNRKYETMVFRAKKAPEEGGQCCPWRIDVAQEVDMQGYNDAESAQEGHMKLCLKWSKK